MQKTMKSAIYYGVQDVRIEERPVPAVGDNDVLVKNLRAGIAVRTSGFLCTAEKITGFSPARSSAMKWSEK